MKSSAEIGEIKEFLDKDILTMLNIKYSVKGEGYYIEVCILLIVILRRIARCHR